MRAIVIIALIAVVAALFTALVFLYRDRGHGNRVVSAHMSASGDQRGALDGPDRVPRLFLVDGLDRARRLVTGYNQ